MTARLFALPPRPVSPMRKCVCAATDGLRLYPSGWRCPLHTPAAIAGEPEPDQILARQRAERDEPREGQVA